MLIGSEVHSIVTYFLSENLLFDVSMPIVTPGHAQWSQNLTHTHSHSSDYYNSCQLLPARF